MTDKPPDLNVLLAPIPPDDRELTPSALGQFIRFDQCDRFMRLDLYRGALARKRDEAFSVFNVIPEHFAPLAREVGDNWEKVVREALVAAGWILHPADEQPIDRRKRLEFWINSLQSEEPFIVSEATVNGTIAGWRFELAKPDLVLLGADPDGQISAVVLDIKSSREVKLEHRIQVAIYGRLIATRFPGIRIQEGIIYRPPLDLPESSPENVHPDAQAALDLLHVESGLHLSLNLEPELIHGLIDRTLFAPDSRANQIAGRTFTELPFHLSGKCDGCLNNPFCLSSARVADDLSLIPYLTERIKNQLVSENIATIGQLLDADADEERWRELLAVPGLGAHLREIRTRARAYRSWSNRERVDPWLRETSFTSLPNVSHARNPNLIQIYLDVQTEPSSGRVAALGALIVCFRNGSEESARFDEIVRVAERQLESHQDEAIFLQNWLRDVLVSMHANRSTDEDGAPRVPVHLYLWDSAQKTALAALANRQHQSVFGNEALFDLITQRASFDSAAFSIIADEIEHQRALPMLCQSLQAVSRWLGYAWPDEIIDTFRTRQFDALGLEMTDEFAQLVPARSRFRSDIPGEYFHAAWSEPRLRSADADAKNWGSYALATVPLIHEYIAHRLRALRHITLTLRTNRAESLTPFDLSVLNHLGFRAETPIQSVREFIALERHVDFEDWRRGRSRSPERRVLEGESLLVRYRDADQEIDTRVKVREARTRYLSSASLTEEQRSERSAVEKKANAWSLAGVVVRLSIVLSDQPIEIAHVLRNTRRRPGDHIVIGPAFARATDDDNAPLPLTARSMLYQHRGVIKQITPDGTVDVELIESWGGRGGFTFGSFFRSPPDDGELLAIEPGPDSHPEQRQWSVAGEIAGGTPNGGFKLIWPGRASLPSTPAYALAQQRFADGLARFPERDHKASHFETAKLDYIGKDGLVPVTLVQGPPGTGKSTTTGFAVLARLQAAIHADQPLRIAIACKTHVATDVLLDAVRRSQRRLQELEAQDPAFFAEWFDPRILAIPLYRFAGRPSENPSPDILKFESTNVSAQLNEAVKWRHVVVAGTTNGLGRLAHKAWKDGEPPWDLLVLDEASQMSVPEFLVAAAGLKLDGSLIVVGDPRQMPPIVRGNWEEEGATPIVDPHAAYRSLFDTIKLNVPTRTDIKFNESFRIHRDVARYLRDQIYARDGIDLHSHRDQVLVGRDDDDLVNAILESDAPVVLMVHDEARSQQRNDLERELVSRLVFALTTLQSPPSIGVVVPHRAQRAALSDQLYRLTGRDDIAASVDTIERFQGAERDVVIVSATESDPAYLRDTASFLLDPRRLTVAISRAEHKLIVIAAQSIFDVLPVDEKLLRDSELWQTLRNQFCTVPLWSGMINGHQVRVTTSGRSTDDKSIGR